MVEVGLRLITFAAGVVGVLLLLDAKHEYGLGMILLAFGSRMLHVRYGRGRQAPGPV